MALRRLMSWVLWTDERMREPRETNSSATATTWPLTVTVNGTPFVYPKLESFVFCQFISSPKDAYCNKLTTKHTMQGRWFFYVDGCNMTNAFQY